MGKRLIILVCMVIVLGYLVDRTLQTKVKPVTKVVTITDIGERDGHFVGIFRLDGELRSVVMDEYNADGIIGTKVKVEVAPFQEPKLKGVVDNE